VIELDVEIEQGMGGEPMSWRRAIDFGEIWTESDAHLWPSGSGDPPFGQPLTYGCHLVASSGEPPLRGRLTLWSIDEPRAVMHSGAEFTFRDGNTARARRRLV
jgi:hypothetical protein